MVSQSKPWPPSPPTLSFPIRSAQGAHRVIGNNFFRMDGPILHPMETEFALPPREDLTHQVMSPFESHLRKWDRKLSHSVATEPGAVNQLSSALQAVKEEKSEAEEVQAPRPIPSLVTSLSPESFPISSPHPPSSSPTISSLSPPSSLSTKVGSSSSLGSIMPPSPLSPKSGKNKAVDYSLSGGDGSASLSPHSMTTDNHLSTASVPSPTSTVSRDGTQKAISGNGGTGDNGNGNKTQWGTPFRVRWIIVSGLPFHSTRILRNPWNKDREVKVSRDGTELEPFVGRALLDSWEVPLPDSADAHGSQ